MSNIICRLFAVVHFIADIFSLFYFIRIGTDTKMFWLCKLQINNDLSMKKPPSIDHNTFLYVYINVIGISKITFLLYNSERSGTKSLLIYTYTQQCIKSLWSYPWISCYLSSAHVYKYNIYKGMFFSPCLSHIHTFHSIHKHEQNFVALKLQQCTQLI